jgi:hypothetical protein
MIMELDLGPETPAKPPRSMTAAGAMTVSLSPALSQREREIRSALCATFLVVKHETVQQRSTELRFLISDSETLPFCQAQRPLHRVVPVADDPVDAGFGPQPCELPLCQLSRGDDSALHHFLEGIFTE